eukprot:CAMPEP_0182870326 /NCGR_PEP_ID=MMETSP0034_2-20130328/10461_1 /TAXON_ID=156128 /ORGANISM="Nephroselmis pyriformis, Strain CCMP717" /LENGTH=39 /DNA_ID= /DNA_START= /DNA_END= /DNA_ORIENTATION=
MIKPHDINCETSEVTWGRARGPSSAIRPQHHRRKGGIGT